MYACHAHILQLDEEFRYLQRKSIVVKLVEG
jgi:hypothetical protein